MMVRSLALTMVCGLALAAIVPDRADAEIFLTARQIGGDVVISGSGSANLTDLTLFLSGGGSPRVTPLVGLVSTGNVGPTLNQFDSYQRLSGPLNFGSGPSIAASTGSGDFFGVGGLGGFLMVPKGYISGASLSGTSTFTDATFASLGMTPGTYTWLWGSGSNADSAVLNIVPEPSTLTLSGLALAGGLLACWQRRRRDGETS